MPFKKGQSGNPNGRAKGKPNKATSEFKHHLNNLLEQSSPDMLLWLQEIEDPYRRFEVLAKFAEYIHPKLARNEMTGKDGEDLDFTIRQVVHSASDRNTDS